MFDQEKLRRALRLYAVTSRNWLGKWTLAEQVEQALRGGATMVQLREKTLCDSELVQEAQAIKLIAVQPVSYTHLDVYKRQVLTVSESVTAWKSAVLSAGLATEAEH